MELWCGVAVRRKGRVLLLKRTHTGDTLWGWWGGRKGQDCDDEVLAGASPSPAQPNHQRSVAVPVGVEARSGGALAPLLTCPPGSGSGEDGWISDAFAMAIRVPFESSRSAATVALRPSSTCMKETHGEETQSLLLHAKCSTIIR